MPKTQEQCAKIREEARKKILSGALTYFAHYGYGNSTVGDLAKYIGIAQGALYRYFSSKAELFQVLTTEVVCENNENMNPIFELPISPEEKIRLLTKTIMDGIFNNARVREGFVLNLRMKLESNDANIFSKEYDREADTLLEQIIKEGQANDSIVPGTPSALSDFYWHSMHMIALDILRGRKLDYQEQYNIVVRILLPD
uniref:TetR/AcrR family transcriptional regulator n=1 Tax=Acetatifactor sp. TaxID=1872090 RepID=UPI004056C8E9